MRKEEVAIRITENLMNEYEGNVDMSRIKYIIDTTLKDYSVKEAETALATLDDMPEKVTLYIMSCQIARLSDATLKSYGIHLRHFANSTRRNVADITTMDIRAYLARYSNTGISTNSLITRMDIIRGFFNWLHTERYIDENPMNRIKAIQRENSTRKPLSPMEVEVLRKGYSDKRDRALVELALSSGMRVSELISIDIDDIDWKANEINIVGKGSKERTVYFNPRTELALKDYINSRSDDCLALFITKRKPYRRITRGAAHRIIKVIANNSGIKANIHFHRLRHTFATSMLAKGASIERLKELLGHESLDMVLEYGKTDKHAIKYEYHKHMSS